MLDILYFQKNYVEAHTSKLHVRDKCWDILDILKIFQSKENWLVIVHPYKYNIQKQIDNIYIYVYIIKQLLGVPWGYKFIIITILLTFITTFNICIS